MTVRFFRSGQLALAFALAVCPAGGPGAWADAGITVETTYATEQGVRLDAPPAFRPNTDSLLDPSQWQNSARSQRQRVSLDTSSGAIDGYHVDFGREGVTFRSAGAELSTGTGLSNEALRTMVVAGQLVLTLALPRRVGALLSVGANLIDAAIVWKQLGDYERQPVELWARQPDGGIRLTRFAVPPKSPGAFIVNDMRMPGRQNWFKGYLARKLLWSTTGGLFHSAHVPMLAGELLWSVADQDEAQRIGDGGAGSGGWYHPMLGWMRAPTLTAPTGSLYIPAPVIQAAPVVPLQAAMAAPQLPAPLRLIMEPLAAQDVPSVKIVQPDPQRVVVYPQAPSSEDRSARSDHSIELPKSISLTGPRGFEWHR